jgi:hypothetical protein
MEGMSRMATSTRIYKVGDRLVRAAHPSTALMHVARETHPVRVATQDDLEDLLAKGVKVETVRHEQAELQND